MNQRSRHTILYISHGGGPLPLLGDKGHDEIVRNLQLLAGRIRKPPAIIVVSAHWEAMQPTITDGDAPSLIYDYYGFPEEAYRIQYPAPGHPELARSLHAALMNAGLNPVLDRERGFDHGLYVPLKIMFPDAEIPCLQLSLLKGLNPDHHIRLGQALAGVDWENLLILGSGFSFHNMKAFFEAETAETGSWNRSFEDWLIGTMTSTEITENERAARLAAWEKGPHARYCHPREEHLLPLHVCYGTAGCACDEHFRLKIIGRMASVYLWNPE